MPAISYEEERSYRELVENAGDAIASISWDGILLDVNHRAELLLGWSREEMINHHVSKVATPASVALAEERTRRFLAGEQLPPVFEAELICKDGRLVPVEARTWVFRDEHGRLAGFHGIYRDLTARRETEAALRESEAALRRERELFISGPVMTLKWKMGKGWPIAYVSPNVTQLGYRPEDLLSGVFSYADLIHPDDLERVAAEVQTYIALGRETFEQEYRLRCADGQFRWVYDTTRIFKNLDGEVTHLDGYILDISDRRQAEQKLQLNEARYRALVEGSIQGICVIHRDNSVVFVNPALAVIYGYDHPDEMIGASALQFVAPRDRERLGRYFVARLRGESTPIRYEFEGLKQDGTPIWLESVVSLVSWDGELSVLSTQIDITARKKAERELQRSEEQYRTLVEQIHDGVYVIQDGVMRFVNEACARSVGYSVRELIGREVRELIAPEDREFVLDRYRRRQAGETLPSQYEFRLLHKDRISRVFVEVRAMLTQYQGGLATLGTMRDVTERKRAEEQLREEAEINAALARVAQEMIASLDTSAVLDRLCRVTTEVLGCDCGHTVLWFPEEKVYRNVAGYGYTPEQWEALRAMSIPQESAAPLASLVLKGQGVVELEDQTGEPRAPLTRLMRQLGLTSSLVIPLRRGQLVIGALTVSYRGRRGFIERQKRLARGLAQIASLALSSARLLEEIAQSNRIKEDFVGTMSHELRTPLNIILGYNHLLLEEAFGPLTVEQINVLERTQKNAHELLELINATLDLSRLQSQRIPLEIEEIKVSEFMADLEIQAQQLNRKPNLQVQWSVAAHLPTLHTDALKLKMVLKNLLTNALKFTEVGRVSVSAVPQDNGVAFIVADTGPGIPADELAVIFEPFRQGGTFATRRQGGVGLGLYIVQQLLNLLGGAITVHSELGKGSTFRTWLPCQMKKERAI